MILLLAAAWWGGFLVGVALARRATSNEEPLAGADREVVTIETTTVTVEEAPAEEDEVDNFASFADVGRN